MKIIGLIGGMSWESSAEYYQMINHEVKKRLGGFNSAKSLMYSINFEEIEKLQEAGDWQQAGQLLVDAAKRLETAGAECLVLCTNTMHLVADDIIGAIHMPFLHIADGTGEMILKKGLRTVGLLGTKYTMQKDFYKQRLIDKYQLTVLVPDLADQEIIHQIIYQELCQGSIRPKSKKKYLNIIGKLVHAGSEGIVLGCTEIGLLIKASDLSVPIFDTTIIHAKSAVDFSLSD